MCFSHLCAADEVILVEAVVVIARDVQQIVRPCVLYKNTGNVSRSSHTRDNGRDRSVPFLKIF